jgi:prefoldin subunit 5
MACDSGLISGALSAHKENYSSMNFSIRKAANGFIVDISLTSYVFKTKKSALAFITKQIAQLE